MRSKVVVGLVGVWLGACTTAHNAAQGAHDRAGKAAHAVHNAAGKVGESAHSTADKVGETAHAATHPQVNPSGIVASLPAASFEEPHDRHLLAGAARHF